LNTIKLSSSQGRRVLCVKQGAPRMRLHLGEPSTQAAGPRR